MPQADGDDRELLEATVEAISEAVCRTLDRSWSLSQHSTLVALARVWSLLAVEHLKAHPRSRDVVLRTLRSAADFAESETGAKH